MSERRDCENLSLAVIESRDNLIDNLYSELKKVIYSDKYKNVNCASIAGVIHRIETEYMEYWRE